MFITLIVVIISWVYMHVSSSSNWINLTCAIFFLYQLNLNKIPVFLPGESHKQRSLVGYSPQGCKEPDMTESQSTNLNKTVKKGGKKLNCRCCKEEKNLALTVNCFVRVK